MEVWSYTTVISGGYIQLTALYTGRKTKQKYDLLLNKTEIKKNT